MEYCGPLGIPHSTFLSWDPEDQDKAIAWKIHEASRCSSCGTYPEDWLDSEGRYIDPQPFVAKTIRCVGCQVLDDKREEIDKDARGSVRAYLARNRER